MKDLIRTLRTAVLLMILATSLSGDSDGQTTDCFARLARANIVGDTLSVFTNDSIIILGKHPVVNLAASVLYMRSSSGSRGAGDVVIPFETINRITYRKSGGARHVPTILGFVFGAAAGVTALNFRVEGATVGGVFGGMVGVTFGHKFGKQMTSAVTLKCR